MTKPSLNPAPKRDPVALMKAEMRVRFGPVGDMIGTAKVEIGKWLLNEDEFLMLTPDIGFHYRKGHGVTIDRKPAARLSEEQLYLNGSVYAAAACLNGFYPIHASAVVWNGGVHAFTGPSGAGKSTMVAALGVAALGAAELGAQGFPLMCDDTMILDLSDPARPLVLPGHKRMKLTAEALALTGAAAQEKVDAEVEKFYAAPASGDWTGPLPLRQLIFLEDGEALAAIPVTGAEKIARLTDDHYTFELHKWASQLEPASRFAVQSRLAGALDMLRLVRPRDTAHFAESVELARNLIYAHGKPL